MTYAKSETAPPPVRRSRWWYVAALVPPFHALAGVVFLTIVAAALEIVGVPFVRSESTLVLAAAGITVPTTVLTFLLPIALYRDIGALETAGVLEGWDPDRHRYAIAAAGGLFVPGVSAAVSAYYLYRRHVHVGTP
ncbi:hypothetical protein [Halopiger aswanensis]|uniref:Uncharacterized protein n=1 Tax=Halopiger aswanensis TaxID=148449 RepID=A0A3R7HXE7_9EURY|nr:hypothetical protein [Halopiger aswanensis]RKD94896.1 hypothetical protein ATJ93_1739 [Halopiger aswanensis]